MSFVSVNSELAAETAACRPAAKFADPDTTAKGEARAIVPFDRLDTLWINTGTLCNITCRNCYIESSPANDRLAYITLAEVVSYLDEAIAFGTREIGFTGGEPFLNPDMIGMIEAALERGFSVLVLSNAMLPMQRPAIKRGLLALKDRFGDRFAVRVSLDHHTAALHEDERGAGTFEKTMTGLAWLNTNGFRIAIAGRLLWGESESEARRGYGSLVVARGLAIDVDDAAQLMLLPEMESGYDGPEITTACWGILNKAPASVMCASSRMVVKRKGAASPVVLPCTLLPYDARFEMGATLADAQRADGGMFAQGGVKLCHAHCAKFCVLGGGRCS